jgi:hypothetical protein
MASVVVNGDTSGAVTLSAPAVAGTVTVTLPSTTGTMLTTASTTGISGSAISSGTVPEAYGGTGTSTGYYGFKNRIINGAMVLAQRGTSAVTVNSNSGSAFYGVDRFFGQGQATDGVFTMQQSSTAPAGFSNSLVITVTTADASLGATQVYQLVQPIEAYNTNDLAWGTASASAVTLSFWVRSSVIGTFGGSLFNSTAARSYPFTYTISSANTFEYKTVTIAGDTSGTWAGTNGVGIYVIFGLGVGSTYSGTAGVWAGTTYNSATGATNLMATNGATFYITGVQLEKGSTATSFDYRPYGTELALCQRYYETSASGIAPVAGDSNFAFMGINTRGSSLLMRFPLRYAVTKRATGSTITFFNPRSGGASGQITTSTADYSGTTVSNIQSTCVEVQGTTNAGGGAGDPAYVTWTASSEL